MKWMFITEIYGLDIHFIHIRSHHEDPSSPIAHHRGTPSMIEPGQP